ncbi:hypothetical protein CDCA_CDCA01G0345 [Cyanidium caldarium]|uniref:K Homology domain-containing protein n=1 Tax=Cyanidium caldarium TaxID=2771 RepID=A0AAV9IPV9_CYACA|nr:hypothetical protein CDCA_CDCA01G0345 [Cyanidium caldarium]
MPATSVVATAAGRFRKTPQLRVETSQRRYVPCVGDEVVAVITERLGGELYRVDMGAAAGALLPALAFAGATKRNRPHLHAGDVVYARVVQVPTERRQCDGELSCTAPGSNKSWVTGECPFGPLCGGTLFAVSPTLTRRLRQRPCAVLEELGRQVAFEIAIGINGRVWVDSDAAPVTILVRNAILASERMDRRQTARLVRALLKATAPLLPTRTIQGVR